MAILDDVLSQIASALGPRGIDVNDANAGLNGVRMRRGPGYGPANPVRSSTGANANANANPFPNQPAGMYGYSRAGRGDDGMYMGAAAPPLPNPSPDDRYAAQRRAAEYSDPHQATHHLRDMN